MPEYWVINGHHLDSCAYLRALQWNEEDGVECDCCHDLNEDEFGGEDTDADS
jgi:hypothetical protein